MRTPPQAGLCTRCKHVKIITSAKGSVFLMCLRASTDRRFRKYPPLPVIECIGFEQVEPTD
jgi:hypothetical protein